MKTTEKSVNVERNVKKKFPTSHIPDKLNNNISFAQLNDEKCEISKQLKVHIQDNHQTSDDSNNNERDVDRVKEK